MGALTGNKPFESEIRFFIKNADLFRQQIDQLGGQLIREYSFVDYYFQPRVGEWNNREKTVRIREWRTPDLPTAVHFTKQEIKVIDDLAFKRSVYEQGKIELFKADLLTCRQILDDLGFQEVFSIDKKHGWVYSLPEQQLEFCLEDTDVLGWTGEMELEGLDINLIKQKVELFQNIFSLTDEQLSSEPVAILIEEKMNRKKIHG